MIAVSNSPNGAVAVRSEKKSMIRKSCSAPATVEATPVDEDGGDVDASRVRWIVNRVTHWEMSVAGGPGATPIFRLPVSWVIVIGVTPSSSLGSDTEVSWSIARTLTTFAETGRSRVGAVSDGDGDPVGSWGIGDSDFVIWPEAISVSRACSATVSSSARDTHNVRARLRVHWPFCDQSVYSGGPTYTHGSSGRRRAGTGTG